MIKKYLIQILPSIIIISLFFIFFHAPRNREAKKRIQELNLQNKHLKKVNDSVLLEIVEYENDLIEADEMIKSLFENDYTLRQKVLILDSDLKILKSKYEKANKHSNNYNSADIKKYFSDL